MAVLGSRTPSSVPLLDLVSESLPATARSSPASRASSRSGSQRLPSRASPSSAARSVATATCRGGSRKGPKPARFHAARFWSSAASALVYITIAVADRPRPAHVHPDPHQLHGRGLRARDGRRRAAPRRGGASAGGWPSSRSFSWPACWCSPGWHLVVPAVLALVAVVVSLDKRRRNRKEPRVPGIPPLRRTEPRHPRGADHLPGLAGPDHCTPFLTREDSIAVRARHRVRHGHPHADRQHRHLPRQPLAPLRGRHRPGRPHLDTLVDLPAEVFHLRARAASEPHGLPGASWGARPCCSTPAGTPLRHPGVPVRGAVPRARRVDLPGRRRRCARRHRLAQHRRHRVGRRATGAHGLLAAGIHVVEHLTNLDALPASGARFTAAPPVVEASAPSRCAPSRSPLSRVPG